MVGASFFSEGITHTLAILFNKVHFLNTKLYSKVFTNLCIENFKGLMDLLLYLIFATLLQPVSFVQSSYIFILWANVLSNLISL